MSSVDGLITGLDTTSIIDQLLAAERIPQNQLIVQKTIAEGKADIFAELRGRYDAVRTAAKDLELPDDWARLAASSSDELVKVSADSGSITGELRFTVVQRATAHSVYSTDTVTSLDDVIAPGGGIFSADGYAPLGFSALQASGLESGSHTFEVTQASAAATKTGTTALPTSLGVNGGNDTIDLDVNGVSYTLALARTTYNSRAEIAAAVQVAIDAQPALVGEISVTVNASDQLEFTTTREGSDATIQITGGKALADLGLSTDAAALTGTDGIVNVNGVDTTVTNTDPGTLAVFDAGVGTITATIAGGLRAGTADVETVSFGDGTVIDVVTAINESNSIGTKAAIIQVDDGEYRLQLTATESGDDSAVDIDLGMFTGLASGFTTLSNGQDAELEVQGLNPYTVRSSSDTFTDLLPGVDVTLAGVPTGEVVVDVTRDTATLADRVQALVDAVNDVVTGLQESSEYDADENEASILTGNSTIRRAGDELTAALIGPVAGASLGSVGLTGLTINSDGTFEFDRAVFTKAYEDDPAAVERVYAVPFGSESVSVASRILSEIEDATAFGTGYLRSAEDAENARVENLDNSIDGWDRRLEVRERTLRATYTRLETMLADLQAQSTWLAGQVANLSTPSSR